MKVQELIEILEKLEDKSGEVNFSYDYRAVTRKVNCVDLVGKNLIFREENSEEYYYHNPNNDNLTDKEAYHKHYTESVDFYIKYMNKTSDPKELMTEAVDYANRHIKQYMLDREEKKKETKNHINLYLSNK